MATTKTAPVTQPVPQQRKSLIYLSTFSEEKGSIYAHISAGVLGTRLTMHKALLSGPTSEESRRDIITNVPKNTICGQSS